MLVQYPTRHINTGDFMGLPVDSLQLNDPLVIFESEGLPWPFLFLFSLPESDPELCMWDHLNNKYGTR